MEENLMKKASQRNESHPKHEHQPHLVRLPGFVSDEDIGLGDVIKRATSYVGIRPCGGCERRAAVLNRWLAFTGRAR
jgi:hypothetical protein